ncbi:MAG TPA: phytanoyl-CoA dioxygenase family protein [Ilumatobacter sp.]|nr:phytanoyl-CoA dioxygenase family protein [Ilumatobacter sp.]
MAVEPALRRVPSEPVGAAPDAYERDGFAVFPQVLDPDRVAAARDHVAWLQERHPERRPEQLDTRLVADDPFWLDLVADDRLLDVAAHFIGGDIALFASHYISKPPFDGQAVLWHQDAAYWPLEPMEVVSLWLAVDDATTENGCLRVVPGSHRWPVAALRERTDLDNVLSTESAVEVDESAAVDVVLQAGDVEVHHAAMLHASRANLSPRRRCGLTIRYIPTTTRVTDPGIDLFLLRGKAVPGVNEYRDRPTFDPARHFAH